MIRKILLYLLPFLSFSAEAMLNYRIEEAPVSATLTAYSRPASPAYDYNPPAWDSGPAFSVDVQQNSFRQEDFAQTTAPDAFSVLQTQISQATDEGLCSQDFLLSKLNDVETQIKTLTECDTQYNKLCDQAAVLRAEGHELTHAEIIRYTQVENWHKQTLESLQKAQKCEQLLLQKMHAIQRQDTKELADFRAKVFTSATPKQLEELQSSLQTERDLTHSKIALATCQRDAKIAEHTEIGNAWRARHGGDPHADSFVIAKRKEISELQHSVKLIDKKLELVSHELALRKEAFEKEADDIATLAKIKDELAQLKTDSAAQKSTQQTTSQAIATKTTVANQVKQATEIAAHYPQDIAIQQSAENLIQLSEATLDMISTPQHILGEVENPYAGIEALKKWAEPCKVLLKEQETEFSDLVIWPIKQ